MFASTWIFYANGSKFFTKSGDFISVGYQDGVKFCANGVDDWYSGFRNDDELKNTYKHFLTFWNHQTNKIDSLFPKLSDVCNFSRDLSGQKVDPVFLSDSAYTLLIPFAKFWGDKMQVKEIKRFINNIRKNNHMKVKVVLLNFDKQIWWGKRWIEEINIISE